MFVPSLFIVVKHLTSYCILILFAVINSSDSNAITSAPNLIRACLDINDSTVTIDYSSITDACGSFNEHHVYGSETSTNYRLLHTETSFNSTTTKFKLPNANGTWSFFFETRYKCNGVDTAKSNIIYIDNRRPDDIEIDSVSIDYKTQQAIVGWTANSSSDTKGYRVYTLSNGISSFVGDTQSLHYLVENQSINKFSQFRIAAFDSCNLFSRISNPHKAISLSTTLDTCTKTAQLTWTPYVGWQTDEQRILYSTNQSTFTSVPVLTSDQSFALSNISLGDSVCFLIQSKNLSGSIERSSTSNASCIKLKKPVYPKETYLSNVSVSSPTEISIESYVDNYGNADSISLYRGTGASSTKIGSHKLLQGANLYEWNDNNVNTNNSSETYFVRTFAPCLGGITSSLNSNTILLKIDNEMLTWNDYINWSGGVLHYDIMGYDGSTWNILNTQLETSYNTVDTTIQCYKVVAKERTNKFGFSRSSMSNEVCVKREPIFYIPNTLNPLSHNHTLRVIGPTIDVDRSTMIVFNRWGEQIFQTNNIKEGWTVAADRVFIPMGIYFYDVSIFDLVGNRHRISGSVRVIR